MKSTYWALVGEEHILGVGGVDGCIPRTMLVGVCPGGVDACIPLTMLVGVCPGCVDGSIPLTMLVGVCQCCSLLMFVCLPLSRHFARCKTW